MRNRLIRAGRDVRAQRNLEAYVLAVAALVAGVLPVFGDLLSDDLRWSVILSALALLVLRGVAPDPRERSGARLADRTAFEAERFGDRLSHAREVWLFAPSGKNFLSSQNCSLIRQVLERPGSIVRCVLLDPAAGAAVEIATGQLACRRTIDPLPAAIGRSLAALRTVGGGRAVGELSCRLLPWNPGFSLVAIDPDRNGTIIVEFHGVANTDSAGRMHLTLESDEDGHWYRYWSEQFTDIWARSTEFPLLLESEPNCNE